MPKSRTSFTFQLWADGSTSHQSPSLLEKESGELPRALIMSLSTWFLTSCLWSPAFPWLTSLELDYRAQRDHGSPLPALAAAGSHWAVRFCSRQGRERSVSQLKMRCGWESCSSSSCSNCNTLLAKLQCLTWMYWRYLLKHAWSIIPIAVDFTQRSFYFISSKELKGKKKKTLMSISVQRYIKLYFSLKVMLSAASGLEAVNPLMN